MMKCSYEDQEALMVSLEPGPENIAKSDQSLPDVLSSELQSLNLHADHENNRLGFRLLSGEDVLAVSDFEELCRKLGCDPGTNAKVVSIIGNAGDGKSYALNKLFFGLVGEEEVFATSSSSGASCTIGAWAAFEPTAQILVIDTEGMHGMPSNHKGVSLDDNRRMRLLLKILAISDIVIFKTRSERMPCDLYYFLGDASKTYKEHFQSVMQKNNGSKAVGPSVVIFHETRYTNVLGSTFDEGDNGSVAVMREKLTSLGQDVSAFQALLYFGVRRDDEFDRSTEAESFIKLRELILKELDRASSPQPLKQIFANLVVLCQRFSGSPDSNVVSRRAFPDEHFTCKVKCATCDQRCQRRLSHDGHHKTDNACVYSRSANNQVYLCLRCHQNGRRNIVVPKASSADDSTWLGLAVCAWSGSVLECRICGVIYRSREHWFGNETPEAAQVVHTEVSHTWPGVTHLQGTHNAARRFIDGVTSFSSSVSVMSSVPAKSLSGWVADKIAPTYWRPNSEITNCHQCDVRLDVADQKIHHCRACGEGFCFDCSDYQRPVPERGWGETELVRVCRNCHGCAGSQSTTSPDPVNARKYGEKVMGTLNNFASVVLEIPLSAIKDTARPAYWVADDECIECTVCQKSFAELKMRLHHCRQCGKGVCEDCSKSRKPVPLRGWDGPVRVCDVCVDVDFHLQDLL